MKKSANLKQPNTVQPWSCQHEQEKSSLKVYNRSIKQYETIAETHPTTDCSAEIAAEFIVKTINNLENREKLIDEMRAALEICLECEGLNWAAEHDAEIALRLAKNQEKIGHPNSPTTLQNDQETLSRITIPLTSQAHHD
jgi:hypothetical protein